MMFYGEYFSEGNGLIVIEGPSIGEPEESLECHGSIGSGRVVLRKYNNCRKRATQLNHASLGE